MKALLLILALAVTVSAQAVPQGRIANPTSQVETWCVTTTSDWLQTINDHLQSGWKIADSTEVSSFHCVTFYAATLDPKQPDLQLDRTPMSDLVAWRQHIQQFYDGGYVALDSWTPITPNPLGQQHYVIYSR
jgi:hypothetical protein